MIKTKNWLLPNIGISDVRRKNGDDDREWICHEQDQFQSASPSKLNFQFIDGPTLLHCEGHNSFIQSEFEVSEHLIESLFDELSKRSGLTLRSRRQGLQIIMISCWCFCREPRRRCGPDIYPGDFSLSWNTP